jgi:putative endonuclease
VGEKVEKHYYIYIMSSRSSTLYIGSAHDLMKRVLEHKEKVVDGFTKRYAINRLVYYEACETLETSLNREKQLKGWTRAKKIALIESVNPEWKDLNLELMDQPNENEITKKTVIKHGAVNEYRKRGHL